jgi:hypothetical protein
MRKGTGRKVSASRTKPFIITPNVRKDGAC